MLPAVFGENLFDSMFDDAFSLVPVWNHRNPLYGKHAKNLMKTDVRETEGGYELDMDLPGFKKEEVEITVENGYLTVCASKGLDKSEKDEKGQYVRRERYAGQCTRSFYVGEEVEGPDLRAKFEDGVLKISVQKKEVKKLPEKHSVSIE